MLLTPTLAFLSIIFNFCALLHVTSDWNGLSHKRWHALDRAIYALEEATVTAYENYLDIVAPPPLTSSPNHFSPLHHAEWVYRSSAVRIINLFEGSNGIKTTSDITSPPLLPPSPPKPTNPVRSASILHPIPTLPIYPTAFQRPPEYGHPTLSVATSSAIRLLGLVGLSCVIYTLLFAWLKNRHHRRLVLTSKPTLTCDVHCQVPVGDFHSLNTGTSIPSYPETEADFSEFNFGGSSGHPPHVGAPRTVPVVVTNPDGRTLFKADIKLSSNQVTTELSATTSTVTFSVDVVATSDIPAVPEWYVPTKKDYGTPYEAEDSLFFLLVRGSSDRIEASQNSGQTSEPETDTLSAEQTPKTGVQALGPDHETEDTSAHENSPLGSPMCPVLIPFHYRGFSAFETALINSGTKARRDKFHKKGCYHKDKARKSIRPKDVRFAWSKDFYSCGDTHMDGCPCEEVFAESAYDEKHPHPDFLNKVFNSDYDLILESGQSTHSGVGGSGVCKETSTVSPGLSVRTEVSPTSIFVPAEPRPSARSDPLFADGKEPAGLDSTVALMPPFGVGGLEPPFRCRSRGIPSPAGFSDGALGEQSMSLEEDLVETGFAGRFAGIAHFTNGSCSPPSPAAPARVNLLMDALEPVLANRTSRSCPEDATFVRPCSTSGRLGRSLPSPAAPARVNLLMDALEPVLRANHTSHSSPEEATFVPQPSTSGHLEYSPLEYSPASVRAYSHVNGTESPEYGDWVEGATQAVEGVESEPALEEEPFYLPQVIAVPLNPTTPPRRRRFY